MVSMSSLHDKYKLDPFNVRIHKLAKKCLNTILSNYSTNLDLLPITKYKYSNYEIKENPIRKRKRPIIQRIDKYLSRVHKCHLHSLNKPNKWVEPEPLFT